MSTNVGKINVTAELDNSKFVEDLHNLTTESKKAADKSEDSLVIKPIIDDDEALSDMDKLAAEAAATGNEMDQKLKAKPEIDEDEAVKSMQNIQQEATATEAALDSFNYTAAASGETLGAAAEEVTAFNNEIKKVNNTLSIGMPQLIGFTFATAGLGYTAEESVDHIKTFGEAVYGNIEGMAALGIEVYNTDGQMKSMQELMIELVGLFQTLSAEERIAAGETIGLGEATGFFSMVADNATQIQATYNDVMAKYGTTLEECAVAVDVVSKAQSKLAIIQAVAKLQALSLIIANDELVASIKTVAKFNMAQALTSAIVTAKQLELKASLIESISEHENLSKAVLLLTTDTGGLIGSTMELIKTMLTMMLVTKGASKLFGGFGKIIGGVGEGIRKSSDKTKDKLKKNDQEIIDSEKKKIKNKGKGSKVQIGTDAAEVSSSDEKTKKKDDNNKKESESEKKRGKEKAAVTESELLNNKRENHSHGVKGWIHAAVETAIEKTRQRRGKTEQQETDKTIKNNDKESKSTYGTADKHIDAYNDMARATNEQTNNIINDVNRMTSSAANEVNRFNNSGANVLRFGSEVSSPSSSGGGGSTSSSLSATGAALNSGVSALATSGTMLTSNVNSTIVLDGKVLGRSVTKDIKNIQNGRN